MIIRLFLFCILGFSQILFSCRSANKQAQSFPEAPTRTQVREALSERGRILVVYAAGDSLVSEKYQTWWDQKASEIDFLEIIVRSDAEVSEEEWQSEALFLCGTFGEHHLIRQLSDHLPFHLEQGGFRFMEKRYLDAPQTLALSFLPHPFQSPLPIALLSGNSQEAVWEQLQSGRVGGWAGLPWGNWSFQIFEGSERKVMGMYSEDWQIDQSRYWSWEGGANESLETPHYRFKLHHKHLSQDALEAMGKACEARYQEIETWVGKQSKLGPISFHIYEEAENMGLQQNRMEQAFVDYGKNAAFALINEDYANNFWEAESRLLINHLLGAPEVRAMEEGLAVYFARNWQKHGWQYWSNKVAGTGLVYSFHEMVNNVRYRQKSDLIRNAFAGAMIDFLLQEWGKEGFLERYQSFDPDEKEIARLEPLWQAYHQEKLRQFQDPHRWKAELPSFHRGMTFAHEGYRVYNGYGSNLAKASMDSLQDLAVNALAIVPYSGTRETKRPAQYRFSRGAGGENDASVVHCHHAARRRGMLSLMKPQIWFPGSWPGDVEMQNEADWKLFFANYREWITHYAMLSEIHHSDIFCVGVEFAKTTLSHPEEWKKMIDDLRHLYSGPMTYAANWGEEFEKLAFGESLDFLAVNCYYPLSKDKQPDDKALLKAANANFDKIEKVAQKYQKQVLFTEVGFRSIERPWEHPHAEANGQAFDEAAQARCYEALFKAGENRDWLAGYYWWKWPSYIPYAKEASKSFTACGKEAQAVLAKWYRETY
ncbi:MAG: hypothetical protein AAFN10_12785 [Bacteroidota bacterium]